MKIHRQPSSGSGLVRGPGGRLIPSGGATGTGTTPAGAGPEGYDGPGDRYDSERSGYDGPGGNNTAIHEYDGPKQYDGPKGYDRAEETSTPNSGERNRSR